MGVDGVGRMRQLAGQLRDQRLEASSLEERLRATEEQIREIEFSLLPDAMAEMGVDRFSIKADGNAPALDFVLGTYYGASISSSWDDDRRERAFAALPPELVKFTVRIAFNLGEATKAMALVTELAERDLSVEIEKGVHPSTLKAWLREQFEAGKPLPDLDVINARVGPRVVVKEIKG